MFWYRWKHSDGDRSCTERYPENRPVYSESLTPDSKKFEILEITDDYSPYLILKVKYPNCSSCSYEGTKILVYKNVTLKDIIYWREIDPHFSDKQVKNKEKAPSPLTRFPASKEGLDHARLFVQCLRNDCV